MKSGLEHQDGQLRAVDRQLGLTFHKIARFRGRYFDHVVNPLGLTHAQVFVINHLLRTDGLTQVELAGRLDLGTVTVSGLIDRLAANGWVRREQAPDDRRSKHVYLTQKARDNVSAIHVAISKVNKVSLEGLNEPQIAQLLALLGQVEENLDRAIDQLES